MVMCLDFYLEAGGLSSECLSFLLINVWMAGISV